MTRPLAPFEERRILPEVSEVRSWPRRREYAWMALAVALACVLAVGPLDYEAARVTQLTAEEEGARVAGLMGEVIAARHFADLRTPHQRRLSRPLECLEPYEQWIVQWGDGSANWDKRMVCVNADLRRRR